MNKPIVHNLSIVKPVCGVTKLRVKLQVGKLCFSAAPLTFQRTEDSSGMTFKFGVELGVVLLPPPGKDVLEVVGVIGLLLLLGTLVGEGLMIVVPLVDDGAATGFCDPDVGFDEGNEFPFGEVGL